MVCGTAANNSAGVLLRVSLVFAVTAHVAPAAGAGFRASEPGAALAAASWKAVHARLQRLAVANPQVTRLEQIGRSSEGRPLWALHISVGSREGKPSVLLSSAQHANEASTPLHVLDAASLMLLRRHIEPYRTWLAHVVLVVVPMVNPDGSHGFWQVDREVGRKNSSEPSVVVAAATVGGDELKIDAIDDLLAGDLLTLRQGVDLNRNYPQGWGGPPTRFNSVDGHSDFYRGPRPASEPEVWAMMGLAGRQRFVASLSYHSTAARLIVPGPAPLPGSADVPLPWLIANRMIKALGHGFGARGRRRFRAIDRLYPVTGVEKDWLYGRHGTLAYVIELPYRRAVGSRLEESIVHTRGAWMTLMHRWVNGPSLSVQVKDAGGSPLPARVVISKISDDGQAMIGGAMTKSCGPKHGWAHFYIEKPGIYFATATHANLQAVQLLSLDGGIHQVEFNLSPKSDLIANAGSQ